MKFVKNNFYNEGFEYKYYIYMYQQLNLNSQPFHSRNN